MNDLILQKLEVGRLDNSYKQTPAHATPAAGATLLTIADLRTGMLVQDPDHATTCVWTMPTAALAVAGCPGVQIGDSFNFGIVNTGTTTEDETITLVAGVSGTVYGNLTTENDNVSGIDASGSSLWRVRFTNVTTDSEAYVVYRLA